MITRLLPAGNLLLLRARNSQGVCIATYIDLIYNKVAVAWGAASFQRFFNLHPNELILWYGMKKLKAKGIEVLQLGDGVKDFKQKMGAHETHTFRLMQARNPLLYYPVFALISLSERVRLIMRKGVGW
jgi:CelD/BcsL family acetyltransferase involved in cellulose biosynthesis